jgi:phenylalanyl-tRNA synthetase alpha chain
MSDIKKIKDEFLLKLNGNLDLNQVNEIKTELFGKTGLISAPNLNKLGKCSRKKKEKNLRQI